MKLKIQSIKNYFKSKKDKGLEPVFFEKIGDKNTSRYEMKENLIKALKKNGWTLKKKIFVCHIQCPSNCSTCYDIFHKSILFLFFQEVYPLVDTSL